MARFGPAGYQYFDDTGKPLSGGKLSFFESGSTTPKTTYSDAGQSIANTDPVILDAGGRQPDVFFSGSAKVVITDANDVHVDTVDPVGGAIGRDAFADWNSLIAYDGEDIVQGSDEKYYKSIDSDNQGEDPVSTTGYWMEVKFVAIWNTAYTYEGGDLAIASDDALYRCTVSSSQGDDPTDENDWTKIGASGWSALVEDLTPQLGGNLDPNGNTVGDASAADLTKLSNVTASATELNHVDGVTSAIQDQLDGKAPVFGANWTIEQSGSTLDFKYNGSVKFSITSAGLATALSDVKKGTP